MNFVESTKTVFTKYATFQGRASRSEFWWWQLFSIILKIVATIADGAMVGAAHAQDAVNSMAAPVADMAMAPEAMHVASPAMPILSLVVSLGLLIPSIAVSARRLHDVNKSGWWLLIAFTIVGLIPLLIWYVKKSDEGSNRFGTAPV
ncbi:MAG: DUF805 domain-containing protein [Pseudomonadota bacterium]